jgi:hypothetical protein
MQRKKIKIQDTLNVELQMVHNIGNIQPNTLFHSFQEDNDTAKNFTFVLDM